MDTITVSATKARNDFFKLLDEVKDGKEVIIKKDNVVVASMVKASLKTKNRNKGLVKAMEEASKVIKFDEDYESPFKKTVPEFFGWDKK
jgi:antitoxin (DNA-binding transcriptional repressor) of toxin-antitoxin stability system